MDQRIGQLRCGKCKAVFSNQSSLSRHEKIHWAALRCGKDGCEKAFSSHKHLYKHLKRHSHTNLTIRIVPFNIRTKIEVMEELGDVNGVSIQQLKGVKKNEEDGELKLKIEVKDEHDETSEKEFDLSKSQTNCVKKCAKKEEKEDDNFCGCKECIREKVTSDDDRVSGTSLPPVPSDDGQFGTGHSQIGLDGDTPSKSTSLYQSIRGDKLDTKLWLRGVIDGLVDPMIDSLFYRLIKSSSTASIAPQRSSTVFELCQLIEGQKHKTYRLLRIDMDRVVNSLFLRLTNKALVNLYLDRSMEVGYSSQVVNPSNQVESPNAQSHQQSSFITQPSTSSTSSFNPHQTRVSELMFQLIAAERVDLKLWLRGEMERLADLTIDSLYFRLIISSSATSVSPKRCSTVSELCQLMEGEEKKMNSSLRNEIDRLVHSLLERLTNKLLVRTVGSGNVDHRSQVNLLNNVESANLESHKPSSFIPQPSSSTSFIDEFEPEVIGETEEVNVEVLQNVSHNTSKMNPQSELFTQFDEYEQDESYTDSHSTLSHKINSISSSTNDHNNTNDEGLDNQPIQDDQPPNGQVNNAIDTQQNWDEPEIDEEGDGETNEKVEENQVGVKDQVNLKTHLEFDDETSDKGEVEIEEEDDEEIDDEKTEIDSDNCEEYENNQDEDPFRFVSNPPIDKILASNQSPFRIQSSRLPKRKHAEKGLRREENNRDNQEDTEEEQEKVTSRSVKRSRSSRLTMHQHKTRVALKKCNYPDCHYETLNSSDLKRHQRFHLGIKPYSCKWSKCDYASTTRSDTIKHIRRKHFYGKPSSSACFDDYVELNEMLLDNAFDGHDADWNVYRAKQKQIITHTLKCPQCDLMFSKHEFTKHMKKKHSIGPFSCLVKDCRESFTNRNLLAQHLAQSHQSITQWYCNNCEPHFTSYINLSNHNNLYHQIGHFQCSFPACTFTGDYKRKVFDHYYAQHRTKALRKCQHPNCQYETHKLYNFKLHQRVHLCIKPYKCKWPLCDFATTNKHDTLSHIRRKHFAQNRSEVSNSELSEFLNVVHELL